MQITETVNQDLNREYKVVLSAEGLKLKVQQKLSEVAKTAKMAGFRPGKVPMHVIEKRYADSAKIEALENSISEATKTIVKDYNLRLAAQGRVDIVAEEDGKDPEYKVMFEVLPEISYPAFESIELDSYSYDIPQKEVDNELTKIAKQMKKFVTAENVEQAEKGHVVVIDFAGKVDGEAFAGGTSADFQLELGSGQFIPGFEDQLIGKKRDEEVEVSVTFPENYGSANLAGKAAIFDVKIKDIKVAEDVIFDDDFSKKFGIDTMQEFQSKVKERIAEGYNRVIYMNQKKELFDKLDELCSFSVPQSMLDSEFKALWQKAVDLKQSNPAFSDKSDAELEREYKKIALRRVKLGLLLSDLAGSLSIKVEMDDLRKSISEHAMQFPGQEALLMDFYNKNPKAVENLKGPIIEDKVVKHILGQVKLQEKQTTTKKLVELMKADD